MKGLFRSVIGVLVLSIAWSMPAWSQDEGGSLDDEMRQQFAERSDVRIVQRRLYEKDGRHQFTLYGSVIPNDPFLDYYPIGLRYDYYLLESLALELDGSYIGDTFRAESDLETFLQDFGANVDLLDQQRWRTHFGLNWAPFYGKLAFLNQKLVHFDLNLTAGFGVVAVQSLSENRIDIVDEFKPEASLGAGFNFFISNTFSIRLDYRQFIFGKAGGGVSNPSEISLGLSFFL